MDKQSAVFNVSKERPTFNKQRFIHLNVLLNSIWKPFINVIIVIPIHPESNRVTISKLIWSENNKIKSRQKKKPLQLSSNCYEGGYSRRAHSEQAHTTATLLLIVIKKAKENPKYNRYVNLRRKHWGPLGSAISFQHFSSKSLLISLMLPLGFGRDLVFEDYTEDLASKTLGQPGVLYDG